MTVNSNPLYHVHPDSAADVNKESHPGGGTVTLEVPSGEGLVEDLFETQLRGLSVAMKEPTLNVLAKLADKLEKFNAIKYASIIDEFIYKIALTDASLVNNLDHYLQILKAVDESSLSSAYAIKLHSDVVSNLQQCVNLLSSAQPNPQRALVILNKLIKITSEPVEAVGLFSEIRDNLSDIFGTDSVVPGYQLYDTHKRNKLAKSFFATLNSVKNTLAESLSAQNNAPRDRAVDPLQNATPEIRPRIEQLTHDLNSLRQRYSDISETIDSFEKMNPNKYKTIGSELDKIQGLGQLVFIESLYKYYTSPNAGSVSNAKLNYDEKIAGNLSKILEQVEKLAYGG